MKRCQEIWERKRSNRSRIAPKRCDKWNRLKRLDKEQPSWGSTGISYSKDSQHHQPSGLYFKHRHNVKNCSTMILPYITFHDFDGLVVRCTVEARKGPARYEKLALKSKKPDAKTWLAKSVVCRAAWEAPGGSDEEARRRSALKVSWVYLQLLWSLTLFWWGFCEPNLQFSWRSVLFLWVLYITAL